MDQSRSELRETDDDRLLELAAGAGKNPTEQLADWEQFSAAARLKKLELLRAEPPASEAAVLAEVDELVLEGVLIEVEA